MFSSIRFYFIDSLTKVQKSNILSSLKIFVKKENCFDEVFLFNKFIENQEYYIKIKSSNITGIEDFLYDKDFQRDIKNIIKFILKNYKYKKAQEPYLVKRKEFARIMRKNATEWRQAHEKPSKKQTLYYNSLCKKYKIQPVDLSDKSKLDLKNMISSLLENKNNDEH